MTPEQRSVKVEWATDDDLRVALADLLADAGVTLEELQDQARRSRFSSEKARQAWFTVSWIIERLEAA